MSVSSGRDDTPTARVADAGTTRAQSSTSVDATAPAPWLADLAAELTLGPAREVLPFTLLTLITETGSWAANAPAGSWARKANAASLAADLTATLDAAGPGLTALLELDLTALAEALATVTASAGGEAKALRAAQVKLVSASCVSLLSRLIDPVCRRAVFNDLLARAAEPDPSATVIKNMVEMLATLLDHAGIDPTTALHEAGLNLAQSRWRPPNLELRGYPATEVSQAQRRSRASDIVTANAPVAHCVAWLSYGDARLNGENSLGPVTFYEVDWAVSNAQRPDGQDFSHKAEVLTLLEMPSELTDIDYNGPTRPYMVLARVDLDRRVYLRALDDAADMVETVLGVVNNHTGGTPWRREAFSALLVDGDLAGTFSGPHGRLERGEPDHNGQNATADAFGRNAGALGALLTAGALPSSLTQALRLVREAGQVGSREDQLNRIATIDAQSALVLQVCAVEHIAVYAGIAEDKLSQLILAGWPIAAWDRDVRNAINRCMRGLGGMDPLFQAVCRSQFGHWSQSVAYDRREQLLENCSESLHLPDVAALLNSIGDAAAAAAMMEEYTAQAKLLNDRLRRTRNALAHGNPVAMPTVASIRELSRYRTDVSLDAAIAAHIGQRALKDLLRDRARAHERTGRSLVDGISLYQQWQQQDTTADAP